MIIKTCDQQLLNYSEFTASIQNKKPAIYKQACVIPFSSSVLVTNEPKQLVLYAFDNENFIDHPRFTYTEFIDIHEWKSSIFDNSSEPTKRSYYRGKISKQHLTF